MNLAKYSPFRFLSRDLRPSGEDAVQTRRSRTRVLRARVRMRRVMKASVLATVLAVVPVSVGISTTGISSASAVTFSAGIWWGDGTSGVGAFSHSDGSQVYCTELGHTLPEGSTDPGISSLSSLPAYSLSWALAEGHTFYNISALELSGEGLRHLNYVLTKWGSTQDSIQAAAVQLAVWDIRSGGASASYQEFLQFMRDEVSAHGGDAAVSLASDMVREAGLYDASRTAVNDPAFIDTHGYSGSLIIAAGTTRVVLTNAIFNSTGTDTITFPAGGVPYDSEYRWTGVPPFVDGSWDRFYTVTANGTYSYVSAPSSVNASVSGGLHQIVATGSGHMVTGTFVQQYTDPDTIWSPVLTSRVASKFVSQGEAFSDTVTFGVAPGSQQWRKELSGKLAPIVAKGVLYGPFLSDPALNPSATPPVGAPVAATAHITTSTSQGPGTYPVSVPVVSTEAGFYTWVWSIDAADQLPSVVSPTSGDASIPVNYFFTDGFGQVSETQVSPSQITFVSDVSTDDVVIGSSFTDTVTASVAGGGWLQAGSGRASFRLRGSVYLSDTSPVLSATPPADAQLLTTTFVTVNTPGVAVVSDSITIPVTSSAHYVTVQWCLYSADQAPEVAGLAYEYCDGYGVPSETARITRPVISSVAVAHTTVGTSFSDDVNIAGSVPHAGLWLGWDGYLLPEVGKPHYDSSWNVVVDDSGKPVLWTQEEITALGAEVKTAQPVFAIAATHVTQSGKVTSSPVMAKSVGEVYWVERADYCESDCAVRAVNLHTGVAGIEAETTRITEPAPLAPSPTPEAAPPASLPHTGFNGEPTAAAGFGAVTLVLVGAAVLWVRRRSHAISKR